MASVEEDYPIQNSTPVDFYTRDQKVKLSLVIIAKAPIPGEAKTRLGASIGHSVAAALYRGFLLDTLNLFDDVAQIFGQADRLVMSPNSQHAAILRTLVGAEWTVVVQERHGLVGGIADAFDDCFGEGADLVVVADSDSPGLPLQHVIDCIELTNKHDVVLGPTADGSYYLIAGRRQSHPLLTDLLLGAEYTSPTICSTTMERARQLGLTSAVGPLGMDINTEDELRRFLTIVGSRPTVNGQMNRLAHTLEALTKWQTPDWKSPTES